MGCTNSNSNNVSPLCYGGLKDLHNLVKDFLVNNYNILPERIAMQSDFLDKNMNQYLTNYFKDH